MDERVGQPGVVLVGREDDRPVTVDLAALAEEGEDAICGSEPAPPVRVHLPPVTLLV